MVKIQHTINLVTELDETNPTAKRIIALGNEAPKFLADVFADFLTSEKVFEQLNDGNTFAIVKLAE